MLWLFNNVLQQHTSYVMIHVMPMNLQEMFGDKRRLVKLVVLKTIINTKWLKKLLLKIIWLKWLNSLMRYRSLEQRDHKKNRSQCGTWDLAKSYKKF